MLPWGVASSLSTLVYRDVYGAEDVDVVTRAVAMRVAPVQRARAVIVGRLADLPVEVGAFGENGEFVAAADQPAWVSATGDDATTPWLRMVGTLDDLLFYGWSLWTCTRVDGRLVAADRHPPELWRFDQSSPTGVSVAWVHDTGTIWAPVTDPADVLLFAGPTDGLLENAADTIRGWRHMERAWVGRVRNPLPLVVLSPTDAHGVDPVEAQKYVDAWGAARMSPTGAVGWLPHNIAMSVHGNVEPDLFDKGRNAARIDVANHTNMPVSYLDGSTSTSSLTYTTQEGSRAQIIDDLEFWLAPIEARLSEPDVAGAGSIVRFNRSNLTRVPNDDHGPGRDDLTPEVPA